MFGGSPADFAKVAAVLRGHEIALARLLAEAAPDTLERLRKDLEQYRPPHAAPYAALPTLGLRTVDRLLDQADQTRRAEARVAARPLARL